MIVYFNGQMMPRDEVRISPEDRGFVFGDGVYEVIRVYAGKLFEADAHLKRLARSLRELRIGFDGVDRLEGISHRLLVENGLETGDAAVYIQITRGTATRKHAFPPADTPPTVYVSAYAFDPPKKEWEQGVKIILVPDIRWTRCDIKSVALLPNVLAAQQAAEAGAKEAVFIRDGAVTEGAHTNFAAVFDGEVRTAPYSNLILPGTTRNVAIPLCRDIGIPVREFPILQHELKSADEAMIWGTTTEVMPVVQIDDAPVGDGTAGPVTRRLQEAFAGRVAAL